MKTFGFVYNDAEPQYYFVRSDKYNLTIDTAVAYLTTELETEIDPELVEIIGPIFPEHLDIL